MTQNGKPAGRDERMQPHASTSMPPVSTFARRGPRLCLLVLGIALSYSAFAYESALNVSRPAVLAVPSAGASPARGPAERVVWVLVDGLRLDASRKMPALNAMRSQGTDVLAKSEFPTFSGPNFVAQASGIEPAASGVLSNGYPGEVALDSVFRRAKLAGLRTAVLTTDPDHGLSETYGTWTDETRIADPDLDLPPATQLVFAHIGYVDWVAHDYGTRSPEYRDAVAHADVAIGRIAHALDPSRDALVVTSDHGNIDGGGHGGTERPVIRIPIVLWGAGVAHRTQSGRGRDVGPTIATLLGIGPLAHATGRSLVDGDLAAARQREFARSVAYAASTMRVDYVPAVIPVTLLALLVFRGGSRPRVGRLAIATTYAAVFAGLALATHTFSFSMSNDSAYFGIRLTVLCVLAMVAQLAIGGRRSLVPAALVTACVVLAIALLASRQPLAPDDGTLRFVPIPALTALAFVCLVTAAIGTDRIAVVLGARARSRESASATAPSYASDVRVVGSS